MHRDALDLTAAGAKLTPPFTPVVVNRAAHRAKSRLRVVLLNAAGGRKFRDITPAGVRWGVLTGCIDSLGTILFVRASQTGRLDEAVVISSLYPAVTVLLARVFLKEHFTRWRFVGLLAALAAVPMIAAQ